MHKLEVVDAASRVAPAGIVDCDIHNAVAGPAALKKYLPSRLHREFDSLYSFQLMAPYESRPLFDIMRADSHPPSGVLPGADLEFMREQLLDRWRVEAGILSCIQLLWPSHGQLASALNRALNDWMEAEWLDHEPRLYGSIAVPAEDAARAVEEIERVAGNKRFVQVLLVSNTREPLGHVKYQPIFEAAAAYDLPVGVHVGGCENPITGTGWGTYFFEQRVSFLGAAQAHFVSIVNSDLLAKLPRLKIVWVELMFSWIPALMWRLDRSWELLGDQLPEGRPAPSQLIRDHFWLTTQPIDQVSNPRHFMQLLEHLDMDDHIMFSTDYPHYDNDSPEHAFPPLLKGELKDKIFSRNALELFRFDRAAQG